MDVLDSYIEAQVHGPLILVEDVEALVLDQCYRHTEVETFAAALPCAIEWHPGFRMPANRLPECVSYRGPEFANLAAALMNDGYLTPREIGKALRSGASDSQSLKRVWHCVAKFGSPS